MKIVATDNFNRDGVSDVLVCENINTYHGRIAVDALNAANGDHGPWFYRLVPDDFKLYVFEP